MSGPDKRLVQSKSGLRVMPINDSERSLFELSEPEWIKDNECSNCSSCSSTFDFLHRKHHCRRCGKIYCNSCSKTKLSLPRMCFLDPVRLCTACAKVTLKENDFYDRHLKILIGGVPLEVNNSHTNSEPVLLHCSLSSDHRSLLIGGETPQTFPLPAIVPGDKENLSETDDEETDKAGQSFSFTVNGNEETRSLLSVPDGDASYASCFLRSFREALRMTQEAKSVTGTGT